MACEALLYNIGVPLKSVFGSLDCMKVHSSLTLFYLAAPEGRKKELFRYCLEQFFNGALDGRTVSLVMDSREPEYIEELECLSAERFSLLPRCIL